ncbi:MAG TPA: Type 1 glutamine amidotransferase-like domain-containing protein [Ktedonobacterales bacterium]|nr:Type 1 glutamine amidotransferase-like domain-containing protein [Ktedonobacterales bacterium]
MKFLLTSAGIKNTSIHNALADLLGKPIAESSALFIPTGSYSLPGGADSAYRLIRGIAASPLCEVGWKSLGVLELTALPSIPKDYWVPMLQETDALLVGGGEPLYLCYWMRESGLADLLPSLPRKTVYVGVSGGSMVAGSSFGETYEGPPPFASSDKALGLVDFAVIGHLDNPSMPDFSLDNLAQWATGVQAQASVPVYAIDDQTAIQVVDGEVSVISEGHWKRFAP